MRKRVFVNPVIGDKATLLKSTEETNGEYTLMEIELIPGGCNLLHFHDSFSEKFTVVEGTLTVQVDKAEKQLQINESHTVLQNQMHCFKNKTKKPVTFQVELRPGHLGFEKSIAIIYGLAADGEVDKKSIPRKFSHLAIIATISGSTAGIFKFLMPLFNWKAARSKEVEKMLMKRYC